MKNHNNLNNKNSEVFNSLALLTELKESKGGQIKDEVRINQQMKKSLSKDSYLSLDGLFRGDIIAN